METPDGLALYSHGLCRQCLSASVPLRELFKSRAFEEDLNLDNPLGYKGKVAKGFASLMDVMHRHPDAGGGSTVSPRGFKRLIGDLAPQFQGYDQHDSQELLSFLLDGLHEDINRVKVGSNAAGVIHPASSLSFSPSLPLS